MKAIYISDIDEWFSSNEIPGGRFAPPYWSCEFNMRITQKRVQNKIVISSFLDRYYSSSNNILLPPLVDSIDDKWQNNEVILPHYDGLRVVYAGTPGRKDLLEVMLEAVLSNLSIGLKIQFVIVGVKAEDISSYKNYSEIMQWPNNIQFVGRVPQNKVPFYYKSSDFSIIVRKNTRKSMAGFPTKFVESMMAGCPVIVNMTSDLSKYIHDGENGIILPNFSVNSLAAALASTSRLSSEVISKMKIQATVSGRDFFHFGNYVTKMNDYLKNIKTDENPATD